MTSSGPTAAAGATHQVPLARGEIANANSGHALTDVGDLAAERMAWDQRSADADLRPPVPAVEVQIRSADAGPQDAELDLARPGLGLGSLDHLEPRSSL